MDFLKKLLVFIFFALTIFSSNCSFAAQNNSFEIHNSVITASKPLEKAYLNNREYVINFIAPSNSKNLSSSRRDEQGSGGSSDFCILLNKNEFQKISLLKNYAKDLNSNSELALLFLLFELQPNAP